MHTPIRLNLTAAEQLIYLNVEGLHQTTDRINLKVGHRTDRKTNFRGGHLTDGKTNTHAFVSSCVILERVLFP